VPITWRYAEQQRQAQIMTSTAARIRDAILRRILDGPAVSTPTARHAAFDNQSNPQGLSNLIDTVARHAWLVRDEHIHEAKAAGASEDEIFELVVCAAVGQASRQHAAALAALDRDSREHESGPPDVSVLARREA
jgi:hypothetical protein